MTAAAEKRKPAWIDEEEERQPEVAARQAKILKKILSQPKWADATLPPESPKDELLSTVGFIDRSAAAVGAIKASAYKRKKDLNRPLYPEGSILSIMFHPWQPHAVVLGANGVSTVYDVDGYKNALRHSMRFRDKWDRPCVARMLPCGTKVYYGTARATYYFYDLEKGVESRRRMARDSLSSFAQSVLSPDAKYLAVGGEYGEVHLVSAATNEILHTYKQEEKTLSLCFTADGQRLIANSVDNIISVFSLRSQRLEHSFNDEGCIHGSVLSLAPNQQLLAAGSMEGVVNVYDFNTALHEREPKPLRSFMNLRTAISDVQFNSSSELLAMCAHQTPSGVKLAHFPKGTVEPSFPGQQASLKHVKTLAFSPTSKYFALGNTEGHAMLYQARNIKKYTDV